MTMRLSLPVGARHAAPEQRRAGVASLQSGAAAFVALMKLHRVSCPSGRGMPRPNSVAPEQRRARTAPCPNSAAPEQRRAGVASLQSGAAAVVALIKLHRVSCPSGRGMPRPNSAALAWRRCNPARQRSRWDRHSAAGCACAPPRRHQSAQECRKLCYRRHPPARSRSRRRGVPFGCMALI